MDKLIIIDGSSILSTSFFGNVPKQYYNAKTEEERKLVLPKLLQTKDGRYTNGVFIMMKVILNLIKTQKPTHLVVAWDLTRETFRKKMYEEYKGHREQIKPELSSQFVLAQEVLKEMNVKQYAYMDYEADDIIGTLSKRFGQAIPTFIYTKDQDSLQLVDDYTRVWLITSTAEEKYKEMGLDYGVISNYVPKGAFEFTPLYIEEFYEIKTPCQIVDRKAIEGDKSDNIPGVSGVGEKAVVPLIEEFGSVEGIYDYIENTPEEEVKEMMKALGISRSPVANLTKPANSELQKMSAKEYALLSKKLATIKTDIPELENVNLEELSLNINEKGKTEKFIELEFRSLLSESN
jgi:5'-3' exonuclease